MKLRNKKTGEIGEAHWVTSRADGTDLCVSLHENGTYEEVHSLAELNEEWEDAPAEPLIKDEKIRKVIRVWAELLGASQVIYVGNEYSGSYCWFRYGKYEVDFEDKLSILDGVYTIAELCGEEEE